jgi:hypothetical protein
MARATALGEGLIVYLDESKKQVSIPLSALYFEGTQLLTTLSSQPSATSALGMWLAYLVAQGRIYPGPAPAPPDAAVLTAAGPGAQGNHITVVVATSATAGAVDIIATEIDTYTNIAVSDLVTLLGAPGTTATPGTQPGMLRAQIPNTPPAPAVPSTAQGNAAVGGMPAWRIVGPTTTATDAAFVLVASRAGADAAGATMTIAVSAGSAAGKMNLTATWTNTVLAVAPGDVATLANKLAPLAFVVTVTQPIVNGAAGPYQLPRSGTYVLSGGTDVAAPTQASTTLVAST